MAELPALGRASGELLVAVNPDPDSTLGYLVRLPLNGGMVFRTSGTWPRVKALYCHPVGLEEWPEEPEPPPPRLGWPPISSWCAGRAT